MEDKTVLFIAPIKVTFVDSIKTLTDNADNTIENL
jgi:hypothetical protein